MKDIYHLYTNRKLEFITLADTWSKKHNRYSIFRVVLFISFLVLFIYFANDRNGAALATLLAVFPILFGILVNKHNLISKKRDRYRHLVKINEGELERLDGNLFLFDEGKEFSDQKHAYVSDLDIFGRNSVYQLLNRANTPSGINKIAYWLKNSPTKGQVMERQEATAELQTQVEWRQDFQAAGMGNKEQQQHFKRVIEWINEPNRIIHQKTTKLLAYVLPVIALTLIGVYIFSNISIYFPLGLLAINGIILKRYAAYSLEITESTGKGIKTLHAYGELIKMIEHSSFKGSFLNQLQAVFRHNNSTASTSILKLQKILHYLQARANIFYLFFNFVLLFDIHLLLQAEKWKKNQHEDVKRWFDTIGAFECINSLSGYAYSNPSFTMPEISEAPFHIDAKNLGHPLINAEERVSNNFNMQNTGSVVLITGSNMSGKSTFLRTLGVNMILAYTGAPVCASQMQLSIMQLFTGMRSQDNLEEHISSFYAELKRIKQLLDLVNQEVPILYMLDEILKGTNSHDRHAGAEALIKQLSKTNSAGFVSTHDLELGKLADELDNVKNYSFNSIVEGDKIKFNYTLEEGLCHSFNASKLMEQIGIKMDQKT